ncbi:hypothetical protein GVN21_18145 [Caulobacter sp. SLTY]|uniref:hypothetical protein n=1 Tax=Caulobacter sp. SLTY TaxID=2683262 RepID=UPI001412A1E3|nr:hypothetical protein [Caulobacter sp. SLTY]NBB17288.1 hypothetical protein [Caulobacter sp. SLTY]
MSAMDAQRFETLAEAHGGLITRWPAAEQDAAYAWLAEAPEAAQAVLSQALALDEALDVLRPPSPSTALRDAVLAAAPAPARPRTLARWLTGAGIGAALAAASAAGVVVGVQVAQAPTEASSEAAVAVAVEDDWILLPDGENQS